MFSIHSCLFSVVVLDVTRATLSENSMIFTIRACSSTHGCLNPPYAYIRNLLHIKYNKSICHFFKKKIYKQLALSAHPKRATGYALGVLKIALRKDKVVQLIALLPNDFSIYQLLIKRLIESQRARIPCVVLAKGRVVPYNGYVYLVTLQRLSIGGDLYC